MTAKRERTSTGARGRLGAGLELRGRLDGRGDLEIEGRLVGGLDVAGEVRVAPGGRIEAQGDDPPAPLRARSLRVAGLIVGDVQGEDVLVEDGGTLRGHVRATRVGLDDGGVLLGTIDMDFELPPELA